MTTQSNWLSAALAWLQRMASSRPTRRTVAILCLVGVVWMLAPLIAISFYAYPTHDDFPNTMNAAVAWARTGSFSAAVQAAWKCAMSDYQNWQGTYVAMLNCAFQPMAFSLKLFWLTPVGTLALLCLSAWYMVWQVVHRVLKADGAACVIVYTALMALMLGYVPGIRELMYWQSAVQYSLSPIGLMFLVGLLVKLHLPQHRALYIWRTLAATFCAVCIGGLPYPLALGITVGLALVTAWCFWRRSNARVGSLIAFVGMLISLIAVVMAPGNSVRQGHVGESMSPVLAIVNSVVEALGCSADWFGPQTVGVALLVAPFLWGTLQRSGLSFRCPGWVSVFSFGVLAASFVPPIFAMGVDGFQLERILGSLYWLYAVLLMGNLLYWLGWLTRRVERRDIERSLRAWQLLLCVGLLAWGLFASGAVMATPTLGAYYSLLTGEAQRYHTEILARQEAIINADDSQQMAQAIQPLSAQPIILPLDRLIYQSDTSLPRSMQKYFRVQQLVEQYGAGNIPEEEWEALGF